MGNFENITEELKQLRQWVCWDSEKVPKIPGVKNKKGELANAKSDDKTTWRTYEKALQALDSGEYSGIGFCFTKDDPYCFIDLDDSLNSETGEIDELASSIIQKVNGLTEISQSGEGLHVIVKAELPEHKAKIDHDRGVEIYDSGRFCFMTGNLLNGYPRSIEARQQQVKEICDDIFGKMETNRETPSRTSDNNQLENLKNIPILDVVERLGLELDNTLHGQCPTGHKSDGGKCFSLNIRKNYFHCFNCGIGGDTIRLVGIAQGYNFIESINWLGGQFNVEIPTYRQRQGDPVVEETEQKLIKPFYLTDYGNAERLVYWHGENIRYCEPMKSWFIWDGKRWKLDDCLAIDRLSKDTIRRIYTEAGFADNENQRKAIADHAKRSEANNKIQAMIALARSEANVIIRPDDLDRDGFLLNCENGTIDLRTGELLPHRKSDNITKIIPVSYDKMAVCPRWELFLKEIFKDDKDLITFIKYAVGYSLTGSVNEHCFFICYGTGRNGKSKFLDTTEYILGDYAKHVQPATLEESKKLGNNASEDVARLKGSRFIASIETSQGRRLAENLIKQMTGDRIMTARELYQSSFQFEQTYKIWLATNHKPVIKGTDNAIWERIKLIPFEVTFPEEKQDKNLFEKLIAEAPGILNWAIEGCLLWQGMELLPVTPQKVKQATADYRAEMDLLQAFIDDCCLIDKNAQAKAKDLYQAYVKWCEELGEKSETQTAFGLKLQELKHNFEKKRDSKGIIWIGLGLKSV